MQGKMPSITRDLEFAVFIAQKPKAVELISGKESKPLDYNFSSGKVAFPLPDTRDALQVKISW